MNHGARLSKLPHENYRTILTNAAERALSYLENVNHRRVFPPDEALQNLIRLGGAVPERPENTAEIMKLLDDVGSAATVATTGGRYFGFVVGGALPAAVAAHWLADAWDQNAGLHVLSPVAAYLEEVVLGWLLDLLGLNKDYGGAFVTGAQMANFTCLAAARHALLEQAGWNVESDGLNGSPAIDVVVSEEVHATVLKALALLGLGSNRVIRVPTDDQGRMRADAIPTGHGPAIICAQAGNVNTGAFDPLEEICEAARSRGAWVHVDAAFGMWAALSPSRRHLLKGIETADSWAVDAHKWLNVPYDSGIAIVKNPKALHAAMSISAPYLHAGERREPMQWTPESSRRARAVEIWAALRSLGRDGLSELIERSCDHAKMFANGLRAAGFEVLNDVVLNQVLVSFGNDQMTQRVIEDVQKDGTCWCGGTVWHGRAAMRISVSSWATTEMDAKQSLTAILKLAKARRA